MNIEYQRHKKRKERAQKFWERVLEDYKSGLSAYKIARKYTNPLTGRTYTRAHIYWILDKLNQND